MVPLVFGFFDISSFLILETDPFSVVTTDSVLVDLDVPLAIMREKLRRERGVELNARNGDGFVFVVRVHAE